MELDAAVDAVLGKCRSCGRTVRWVTTVHGRPQPLDPDPDPAGNVTLDEAGLAHQVRPGQALRLTVERGPFMPHAATCGGRGLTASEVQRALRRTRTHVQRELEALVQVSPDDLEDVKRFFRRFGRRFAGARW